jgi:flagellar hook-length control protein FliK
MSMIIAPPAPPPSPASQGPPKKGGSSAPPGGDPFASVLDEQARTATAEGLVKQQDAGDANGVSGRGDVPAGTPQQAGTDAVAPSAEGTDPAALAAALNSLLNGTTPAPTAPVATPAATGETPAEQAATLPGAAAAVPAVAETAESPALPAAPAQATSPTPAQTPLEPTAPAAPQPVASERLPEPVLEAPRLNVPVTEETAPEERSAAASASATATTDDAPAATGTARGDASSAGGDGGQAPRQPAQQASPPTGARADGVASAPTESAPTAPAGSSADAGAAAQPAAPAAAPAAQNPNGSLPGGHPLGSIHTATAADKAAAAALPTRPVTLDHAVETVRLAMRAGAERGVTHARISLSPAELGGIEIHLRHTADGIVAKVIADSAGAAQVLQQSAGDLQRELEQQGLNLLTLDIGASGQQAGEAARQQGFGEQLADGSRGRLGDLRPDEQLLTIATDAPAAPASLRLPNGALVDVLA